MFAGSLVKGESVHQLPQGFSISYMMPLVLQAPSSPHGQRNWVISDFDISDPFIFFFFFPVMKLKLFHSPVKMALCISSWHPPKEKAFCEHVAFRMKASGLWSS